LLRRLPKPWLVSLKNKEVTDWPNAPGSLKTNLIGSTIRHIPEKSIHVWLM
jgi:hypothetical protein